MASRICLLSFISLLTSALRKRASCFTELRFCHTCAGIKQLISSVR